MPLHRQALQAALTLAASDSTNADRNVDVEVSRLNLADALADSHAGADALAEYVRAREVAERLRKSEPSNSVHTDNLALIEGGIARLLADGKSYAAADSAFRRATPLAEAAVERSGASRRAKETLAMLYLDHGKLMVERGQHAANAGDREELCANAQTVLSKSSSVWRDMQAGGALPKRLAGKAADAVATLAACAK